MPSRNVIKKFAGHSYYHIYNRGVEKRRIFMDDRDYAVFLNYLKVALSPELEEETKDEALSEIEEARLRRLRLHEQIDLLAYCLMPNHFHLLIYQKDNPEAMTNLMRSVMNGYVRYFNKRYDRVGGLFQGRYKATLVSNEAYLQHIGRYIHLNPKDWENSTYSSYRYYGEDANKPQWLNTSILLGSFNDSPSEFKRFHHDLQDYRNSLKDTGIPLADK
jgi:putative transposase